MPKIALTGGTFLDLANVGAAGGAVTGIKLTAAGTTLAPTSGVVTLNLETLLPESPSVLDLTSSNTPYTSQLGFGSYAGAIERFTVAATFTSSGSPAIVNVTNSTTLPPYAPYVVQFYNPSGSVTVHARLAGGVPNTNITLAPGVVAVIPIFPTGITAKPWVVGATIAG